MIIKLTIPWSGAQKAYQSAVQRYQQNLKLPGFRKGKVPVKLVEEQVGEARLFNAALEKIVPDHYMAALKKSGKVTIAQPEYYPIKIEKGSDWEIEAHTAEKPEINLKNYQKIINDARTQVEKEIETERKKDAKAEKSAQKDNSATKAAPKTTDAATMAPEQQKRQDDDRKLQAVLRALITELKPAIPEILIKQQAHREHHRLADQLKQMGMTVDQYIERRKVDVEALSQELTVMALSQLQNDFILEAIGEDQKIDATPADIKQRFGDDGKLEKASLDIKRMIDDSIKREKLVQFLLTGKAELAAPSAPKARKTA